MAPGLSPEQVELILTSLQPAAVLGRQLGVSHQAVCDVRNNKTHQRVRPDLPRVNPVQKRSLRAEHIAYIRNSDESLTRLSERFGVSRRTILSAKRGETYKDVGHATPLSDSDLHCRNCHHWSSGCGLGFPEALEDPGFAAECSLFSR